MYRGYTRPLVERARPQIDPYASDPGRWAHSMQNLVEIILPCLDAAGARSVVEVGAYAGDLTELLVEWAGGAGARVTAIDPSPQERLVRLAAEHEALELVRETSLDALPRLAPADAVVVDGDHNYFTVAEELRLVAEAAGEELPLLVFHDVCWPHGRRDDYYAPERIPAERRQPIHAGGGLHPDEPGIRPGALPYRNAAAREGGPLNGVLTAVEDFVAARAGLRLAVVPAFFGLGVVWRTDAPSAGALAELLDPWDRNPLIARLEANRVHHLAESHVMRADAALARQQLEQRDAVLRRLLDSSAFAVAERLSRLRDRAGIARAQTIVSRDEIRRALGG
jgi:Methyltransferase domain